MRTIRSVHFGTGIALFFAANTSLIYAADVSLAELDGAVIETMTVHDQVGVLNGMRSANRLVEDRKITIGPGPTLQNTIIDTISSERGTKVIQFSGTFTINKAREIGSHGVYIFANGTHCVASVNQPVSWETVSFDVLIAQRRFARGHAPPLQSQQCGGSDSIHMPLALMTSSTRH